MQTAKEEQNIGRTAQTIQNKSLHSLVKLLYRTVLGVTFQLKLDSLLRSCLQKLTPFYSKSWLMLLLSWQHVLTRVSRHYSLGVYTWCGKSGQKPQLKEELGIR